MLAYTDNKDSKLAEVFGICLKKSEETPMQ